MKKGFIIIAAAFILISCATKPNTLIEFDKAPLYGMIYDSDNNPLDGVRIKIQTVEIKEAVSDIEGRFVISELKKGDHTLIATADHCEELRFDFSFMNRGRAIYLKMISFGQLINSSEYALETKEFKEAEKLLDRAAALRGEDPLLLYLKAVLFFKTDQPEKAEEYLIDLINLGYEKAYVYLFLADLYEYSLNKIEEAVRFLTEYLKIKTDPETGERLRGLMENTES